MTDPTSLQNLHPIVLPPEVGLWPPAPGWYLVLIVSLLFAGRFLLLRYRKFQANRYRFEAQAELSRIRSQLKSERDAALRQLPFLVKSTALKVYPRKTIAKLYGVDWLRFLDSTIESDRFSQGAGSQLPDISYSSPEKLDTLPAEDVTALFELIDYWLLNHQIQTDKGEAQNV